MNQHFELEGETHDSHPDSERRHPEAERSPRRLRRVSDLLPVRLQDLLHCGQPEMRK